MFRALIGLIALALPAMAAAANGDIEIDSDVFVEKTVTRSGEKRHILQKAARIAPGDRLVFILRYRNEGDANAKTLSLTNPMPRGVRFLDTPGSRALVSVDGGRSWGVLRNLSVRQVDGGTRPAEPADVTHVRWRIAEGLAAGEGGKVLFRGTAR